jgi:hypothetical protein
MICCEGITDTKTQRMGKMLSMIYQERVFVSSARLPHRLILYASIRIMSWSRTKCIVNLFKVRAQDPMEYFGFLWSNGILSFCNAWKIPSEQAKTIAG